MGGKTIVNEEKRIGEFQVNSATYGVTVPLVIGTSRIAGNVIDYFDFTAIQHTEKQSGGKGGAKIVNKSYTYTVAAVIGLAEGPIKGVGRIWKDKDVFATSEAFNYANTQQSKERNTSKENFLALLRGGLQTYGLTPFLGAHGQSAWSYTQTKHPEKALPYSGLAYMAGVVDLGSSASLPNLNFEVVGSLVESSEGGDGLDANPADTLNFILSDPVNGLGFDTVAVDAASLNRLRTFCKAADILVSLPLTEQRAAHEIIRDICDATNTIHFWSQNRIKFVPRCDERLERNGVVFEPDTVPEYNLDADDFLEQEDGALVTFERADNSEAYNHATVEFLNRENDYQAELAEHKIQVDINRRGLRSAPTVKLHYIHTKERAEYIASLIAMASLYGRTKYRFRLGWAHCRLEPGDFVTLTEPTIGLNEKPVIMDTVEEDEDGALECVAKERPPGIYSPAKYDTSNSDRPTVSLYTQPGNVNPPVIFEPPYLLSETGLEVWIGACGGTQWGGCNVWVSDDGNTYRQIGEMPVPARIGTVVLAQDNKITVDMSISRKQLLSGTAQDADNHNTLCYVDGELIAYETATLIGVNKYELTGLRRGLYGTTVSQHNPGAQFMRIDEAAIFKYAFSIDRVGKSVFLKYTSYNTFGVAQQDLGDVQEYVYALQGSALNSPLLEIENVAIHYEQGNAVLTWDAVTDFRSPLEYEIRKGPSPKTAAIVSRNMLTRFVPTGNGDYWIAAAYGTAYSLNWTGFEIAGARVVQNVIAEFDERATGWSGSRSGGCIVFGDDVRLQNTGIWDDIVEVDAIAGIDTYGPIAGSGIYEIPADHTVDIGEAQLCNVAVSYALTADVPAALFDATQDVDTLPNVDGDYARFAGARIQINTAGNDGAWNGWQDYYTGQYFARKFSVRAVLSSYDPTVTAILSELTVSVDVPDKSDSALVTLPAGGASILYQTVFHAIPKPQITIFDAHQGDELLLTNQTIAGFSAQVVNSGVGVERTINYFAQKY